MRALATLFLLLTGVALAQPPRVYFPWWEGRFAEEIDLTDGQRQEIRAIQKKYREQMIDQRATVEKAEGRLRDLFGRSEISDAAAKEVVDDLVAARGEMTRSLTLMSVELRRLLTPGQWRSLEQRQSEWRSRRMDPSRRRGRPPTEGGKPGRPGNPDEPPPPPEPDQP
jgi:Spy/CpxP family protein refolding chaperone